MSAKLAGTLQNLLPSRAPVYLLDFPAHGNVGDSAIFLGQLAILRSLGTKVAAIHSMKSFRNDKMPADRKGLCLLLHGGGNFGDLWLNNQEFRLRIVKEYPNSTIIQFPQSIHFRDPQKASDDAELIKRHKRFFSLTRDAASYEYSCKHLGRDRSFLAPDAALALGPITGFPAGVDPCTLLGRTDKEVRNSALLLRVVRQWSDDINPVDWQAHNVAAHETRREAFCQRWAGSVALRFPCMVSNYLYEKAAAARLQRGLRVLARGQRIVTDRLHAVILGMLLGRDTYFADNSYAKLSNFYKTWIQNRIEWVHHVQNETADVYST